MKCIYIFERYVLFSTDVVIYIELIIVSEADKNII